jgi:ppGpp synthetase/RelA/SpoT-type nucleotidyltranferase
MTTPRLTKLERRNIDEAVEYFAANLGLFERLAESLEDDLLAHPELLKYIHFAKSRVKGPDHLRDKLIRKAVEAKGAGRIPTITARNLFTRVTDLAGVRLLHLHTDQMRQIAPLIGEVFAEHRYRVKSGPVAHCWDSEYQNLFRDFGIKTLTKPSMYTSVHYVVQPNRETTLTAELQVRTVMEDVWGEVSHRVDYPVPTNSRACKDELKVLARMTSGCTRLVDSIFKAHSESQIARLS